MLIDDKGRLFGLINLLDLLVLLALLALLYLGLAAALALREGAPRLEGFAPAMVTQGAGEVLTLQLHNERQIVGAEVRLLPQQAPGQVRQYAGITLTADRRRLDFPVPAELEPGQYQVELLLTTADAFRRQSLFTLAAENQLLTINPADVSAMTALDYPWPVQVELLVPPGEGISGLATGRPLVDPVSGRELEVLEVRPSRPADTLSLGTAGLPVAWRGGRTVRVRLELQHSGGLLIFQDSLLSAGRRLRLLSGKQELEGWVIGNILLEQQERWQYWEMGVVLLGLTQEQFGRLQVGMKELDRQGQPVAELTTLIGRADLTVPNYPYPPLPGAVSDSGTLNLNVRMRLRCERRVDRLVYGRVPVAPGALLNFKLGGMRLTGTVLREDERFQPCRVNVYFPMVPEGGLGQLKAGQPVYLQSNQPVGRVLGLLAAERIEAALHSLDAGKLPGGSTYTRALASMELYCTLRGGVLSVGGQNLAYGGNLQLRFPAIDLEGVLWQSDQLPPVREVAWEKLVIVFRGIVPEAAALVREGMEEEPEGRPTELVLEKVLLRRPARMVGATLKNGVFEVGSNPLAEDIYCLVRIRVERQGERLYRGGQRLTVGGVVPFNTARLALNGTIFSFDPDYQLATER